MTYPPNMKETIIDHDFGGKCPKCGNYSIEYTVTEIVAVINDDHELNHEEVINNLEYIECTACEFYEIG